MPHTVRPTKVTDRTTPSRPARIITIVAAVAWLAIGVAELISPHGWDASYGVTLTHDDGLTFVRAVGARNIAISLIALFFALRGMRTALAAVFAAIAVIAAMDFATVSNAVGAGHAIKHACFVVITAGIAGWVARSLNRDNRPAATT